MSLISSTKSSKFELKASLKSWLDKLISFGKVVIASLPLKV
jgi:hypothetical protein